MKEPNLFTQLDMSYDEMPRDITLTPIKKPKHQDMCPDRYTVDARFAALMLGKVIVTLEAITPERALCYLACLPPEGKNINRKQKAKNLKRLSAAMKENRFPFNGASIVISDEGYLIDGQHRLLACVAENKTIFVVVVRGVSKETFATIDIGPPKTFSDMAHIAGEKNANDLSAAVKIIASYKSHGRIGESTEGYTPDLAPAMLEDYGDVRDYAESGRACEKVMARSLAMALHYLFAEKDKAVASEFMCKLGNATDGVGVTSRSDLFYVLKTALENLKKSAANEKAATSRKFTAVFMIQAWNAYIEDRKITRFKVADGEPFPAIGTPCRE